MAGADDDVPGDTDTYIKLRCTTRSRPWNRPEDDIFARQRHVSSDPVCSSLHAEGVVTRVHQRILDKSVARAVDVDPIPIIALRVENADVMYVHTGKVCDV